MAEEHVQVLVVDDDPAIRRLIAKWLSVEGYHVAEAADGQTAIQTIDESCPNFLVTDWEMPGGMSGLELCEHVRRTCLPHYVYTVMLTGRSGHDDFVHALRAGADDFTRKPIERVELLARLQAGARVVELEQRLVHLANRDPLTGLATKRTFQECLEREFRRALRYRTRLSCAMLDIDYFKRINDTHGHPAGDEVIRTFARLLIENTRSSDFVARVGGEEFCVLLTDVEEDQAVAWAERVRVQFADAPIVFGGATLSATASFGVAEVTAELSSPAELYDLADRCLLAAKQAGRDRVVSNRELQRVHSACRDPQHACGAVFADVAARDVMTTIVAALPRNATIGAAARYFLRFRFNSAPVVDEQGKLVGFLSEKDVMNVLLWPDCWTRKIADVMKTHVICYEEQEPVLSIYEFLCRLPIRSVVIVRDGRPTGIISRGALLRWFGNAVVARQQQNPEGSAGRDRRQLALVAAAVADQAEQLHATLAANAASDLTPHLVGGVSRIQELVNDLLAGGQQVVGIDDADLTGATGGTLLPDATSTRETAAVAK